jgi:hypothetical protein
VYLAADVMTGSARLITNVFITTGTITLPGKSANATFEFT